MKEKRLSPYLFILGRRGNLVCFRQINDETQTHADFFDGQAGQKDTGVAT